MLCACDKPTTMSAKDTTFVSDGRPCCSAKCYWYAEGRAAERRRQAAELERRETAARIICMDSVPSTVYAGEYANETED